MTKRLATICLVAMFSIGFAARSVRAQDPSAPTLKGITAVAVLVEDLPDGAKLLGLTRDAIQTDVELKLRLAGMRVVTRQEDRSLPGGPFLWVSVNLTSDAQAASINIALCQNAILELNYELAPAVRTWLTSRLIVRLTGQRIRDDVKDDVDEFLNAWLSVNPKK